LISQGVPQLGASNNGEMAKQVFIHARLSRAYLALARLSCFSQLFLHVHVQHLIFFMVAGWNQTRNKNI